MSDIEYSDTVEYNEEEDNDLMNQIFDFASQTEKPKPKRAKKELTPERKQALRDQLARAREAKQKKQQLETKKAEPVAQPQVAHVEQPVPRASRSSTDEKLDKLISLLSEKEKRKAMDREVERRARELLLEKQFKSAIETPKPVQKVETPAVQKVETPNPEPIVPKVEQPATYQRLNRRRRIY